MTCQSTSAEGKLQRMQGKQCWLTPLWGVVNIFCLDSQWFLPGKGLWMILPDRFSPGRFLMILPGRADLQGEVPPFLVSPGLDQRSRRRWIWKFQQFGHCWSHLKRMLPPSRDDHMNIFTALKVTKRAHAGSMPSWKVFWVEKTNTEKISHWQTVSDF